MGVCGAGKGVGVLCASRSCNLKALDESLYSPYPFSLSQADAGLIHVVTDFFRSAPSRLGGVDVCAQQTAGEDFHAEKLGKRRGIRDRLGFFKFADDARIGRSLIGCSGS